MDEAPLAGFVRRLRVAWRRRARKRARGCIRCGAPAGGACAACHSLVCVDCSVVSIETGVPMALCLSCSGGPDEHRARSKHAFRAWDLFRSGASLLGALIVVVAGFALRDQGWPGVWKVFLTVLHPGILLGLVPLAVVLGAAVSLLRKFLFGRLAP